ncbi:hypothetical protein VYU27_004162 [Nannochloropsis oceanica]
MSSSREAALVQQVAYLRKQVQAQEEDLAEEKKLRQHYQRQAEDIIRSTARQMEPLLVPLLARFEELIDGEANVVGPLESAEEFDALCGGDKAQAFGKELATLIEFWPHVQQRHHEREGQERQTRQQQQQQQKEEEEDDEDEEDELRLHEVEELEQWQQVGNFRLQKQQPEWELKQRNGEHRKGRESVAGALRSVETGSRRPPGAETSSSNKSKSKRDRHGAKGGYNVVEEMAATSLLVEQEPQRRQEEQQRPQQQQVQLQQDPPASVSSLTCITASVSSGNGG